MADEIVLRTLRVSSDLDSSGFTRGAAQMAEAQTRLASGNRMVSVTLGEAVQKVSQAGDPVARLSRQYVDGYATAARFEQGLRSLNRALETGRVDAEQAQTIYQGMTQKLGLMADGTGIASQGFTKLGSVVENVNQDIERGTAATEHFIRVAREAQHEANAVQIAAANQNRFNAVLGVASPQTGVARASAATFEAEFERLEQISRLRAEQIGQAFAQDLNASLVAGTGKSARDAASVFSAELDRFDEIARLRAAQAGGAFTSDLNARLGVGGFGTSARDSASVFVEAERDAEAYQTRVSQVRAEIDPLAAAIERMNAELAEYATMMQRGDLTTEQFATAQTMARARVEELRYSMNRSTETNRIGGNMMAGINSAQQVQDIFITAAMGQSIPTIALQQGTQLGTAALMSGAGGGPVGMMNALRASMQALINPTMLVAVGFTGLAAAAIQWATSTREAAVSLEDRLKTHRDLLDQIAEGWEKVENSVRGAGRESQTVLSFLSQQAATDLRARFERDASSVDLTRGLTSAALFSGLPEILKGRSINPDLIDLGLEKPVTGFLESVQKGLPDIARFNDALAAMGQIPGASKEMRERIQQILELTRALGDAQRAIQEYDRNIGPGGLIRGDSDFNRRDMQDYEDWRREEQRSIRQRQAQFDAEIGGLGARSPQERAAAARERERASLLGQPVSGNEQRLRIELAGSLELARAMQELADAQEARNRALDQSVRAEELELGLIGATVGEAARLRFEFEHISQVREEAARNGIEADEQEIALIRQKAEEIGRIADAYARASLARDVAFERDQIFRSPMDQEIASRLNGAGLPVDLDSYEAGLIRANLILERNRDIWQDIRNVGGNAIDSIVESATEGFSNIEDALKNIAGDILREFSQLAISNPLKNAIYGTDLGTIDDIGGIGGFFRTLAGGGMPGAARSVASMQVNAASVVITGSIGGLGGDLLNLVANDNSTAGKIVRMQLPPIGGSAGAALAGSVGSYTSAIGGIPAAASASYGSNLVSNIHLLAQNIGTSPRDLAALMSFESGLRPNIWGGAGGRHFGLIQAGPAERAMYGIDPNGSLAQQFAGIEAYFKDRGYQPGMGMLDLYSTVNAGRPGLYNRSDTANGGTWGTVADKVNFQMADHYARADRLLGGSAGSASKALDDMTTSAASARDGLAKTAEGLGSLGDGMSQAGQKLAQAAVGGGGGGGGLLSAIMGFGGSLLGFRAPIFAGSGPGGIGAAMWGGSRISGFAGGTESAPPGWAWIGEEGPELMRLRGGETIRSHPHSMQMVAQSRPVINVKHTIVNNAGVEVRTEQTEDEEGNISMHTFIDRAVADNLTRRGTASNAAARSMGMSLPRKRR